MTATFLALSLTLTVERPVICLDPGHPSENGIGAKGKYISELQLVWNVSLLTKPLLEKAGYEVVLTKATRDEKVTNRRRAEIGNEAKADLMIRIHADAGNHSGFATFYPHRQARVQGVLGPPTAILHQMKTLAPSFHKAAYGELMGKLKDLGVQTEAKTAIGARQGALTGSVFSKVPVLLLELCVVTNDQDSKFASTKEGQEAFARAILAGTRATVPLRTRR
ncbi:MAG: N-acetylmuramoyl-L-alanine amidase [Fimbriimonadaceae bacterium]|jgi:N-acetylmuramoyl-L-alanine amidase|nr:N-acetylmuramoyl-L-alanine amidase [Fimbriimonadaceae bacterium]